MSIYYRQFKTSDKNELTKMIKGLYSEDFEGKPITIHKINKTIKELSRYPEKGIILIIEKDQIIIGYCILIFFWSNEYGGNILDIDELYIKPDFRGKKVATDFINYLIKHKYSNSVAIQLEVMPSNEKVKKLYEKCGFELSKSKYYIYNYDE